MSTDNGFNIEKSWEKLRQRIEAEEVGSSETSPKVFSQAVQKQRVHRGARKTLVLAALLLSMGMLIWLGLWAWQSVDVEPGGTVTGQILNLDGSPVSGVWVHIINKLDQQAVSDQDGRFELKGVASGEQWVMIETTAGSGLLLPVRVVSRQSTDIGVTIVYYP